MRSRDSNPRPLEHESPPLPTRPGLPPMTIISHLTAIDNAVMRQLVLLHLYQT